MIAVDTQPFSIVGNAGRILLLPQAEPQAEPRYVLPSRRSTTEKEVPKIHSELLSLVRVELLEVKWLSFTSDIWSTEVRN